MWRSLVLPLLSLVMLGLAGYHLVRTSRAEPKLLPPAQPARTAYGDVVCGAGLVEPRTENVSIGAHISGVVAEVFVKVGQQVPAGARLFRIDDRQVRAELRVKEAILASMQAQLARLKAMPRAEELPASEAKVREAEANLVRQADLLERGKRLLANRVLTQEEIVTREQNHEAARQQLSRAQAEHQLLLAGAWAPDKIVAQAAVDQAAAEVDRLKIEIERLTVKAPIAGEVLQLNIRPGEFVATPASQNLLMLGDVDHLHVRVDIDEHDIPRFRADLPARAVVRGDAQRELRLTFVRVEPFVIPKKSLTGQTAERVDTRVLPVIYALEEAPRRAYVGQQVDVFLERQTGTSSPSDLPGSTVVRGETPPTGP